MTALRSRARTEERASLVEMGLAAYVNRVIPVSPVTLTLTNAPPIRVEMVARV